MLPEKLCHTENMAPGTAAMGNRAKWVAASEVARPEFQSEYVVQNHRYGHYQAACKDAGCVVCYDNADDERNR